MRAELQAAYDKYFNLQPRVGPMNIHACNAASSPHHINLTEEANAPRIYAAISAKMF